MSKLAKSPIVQVVAQLKAPNWSDKREVNEFNKIKHKVAKSRFKWDPSSKTWSKDVQKVLIDEGKINFDFDWFIRD
jgi:DNA polymerase-3 subunit epsilon